jgi:hypothetical protein
MTLPSHLVVERPNFRVPLASSVLALAGQRNRWAGQ